MDALRRLLDRFDRFQQRHTALAFPLAVVKKFGDDRAGTAAATIAYYGFLSLFPLLLALSTVAGIVLRGHPGLRARILASALAGFPVVGEQLRASVHALPGSGLALVLGLVLALWAGLGVANATQQAMNDVWAVPRARRPSYWQRRVRSLALIGLLGASTIAATLLAGIAAAAGGLGWPARVASVVATLALNLVVFAVAFRVLTNAPLSWRTVLPGAAAATVGWAALQALGTLLVARRVASATPVYGTLGFVIGLLAWISLGAQLVLYAAEVNAVLAGHRWPRRLFGPPGEDPLSPRAR